MTTYSIIIPHKDIPKLLQRCLDSIPERDDIQIIIVDDNSDPNRVDFSIFPGLDRKNTEVYFTKEGKGAGYARNVGLQHAKGKWLIFADADDFFASDFSRMLDVYAESVYDVIYCKVESVDSDTLLPADWANRAEINNRLLDEVQKNKDWDLLIAVVTPWGKFVKRTLIEDNQIRFQEIRYSNDIYFSVRVATVTTNILISDFVSYCVTDRQGSLTSVLTVESAKVRFFAALDKFHYLKKLGKVTYYRSSFFGFWWFIFKKNKIQAISLLPQLIRVFDIKLLLIFLKGKHTNSIINAQCSSESPAETAQARTTKECTKAV